MRASLGLALLMSLSGAAQAQLGPTPQRLDFGTSGPACPSPRGFVYVQNVGEAPLEITDARIEGPDFVHLDPSPVLPEKLLTEEHAGFRVVLSAPAAGPWQATLTIETANETRRIQLMGDAYEVTEDEHVVATEAPVDLLLMIDDAPSMKEEQRGLHANLQALGRFLRATAADANVAVITPGAALDGRMRRRPGTNRPVIHVSDPAFEEDLAALTDVGTDGLGAHRGLEAIRRALSPEALAGPNAGFLREGSILSVIIISDAEDRSRASVGAYTRSLRSLRGFRQTRRLTVSAVVGDRNGGCAGAGGVAQPGARYAAVARPLGGVTGSICSPDWSRALEDLSTTAFGVRLFLRLRTPAIPQTLRVFDDLEPVPETSHGVIHWTYDDANPSVGFSPYSTPEPASRVRIEYTPRCRLARAVY